MKTIFQIVIATILTISTFCVSGQDTIKAVKIKEYYLSLTGISPFNISIFATEDPSLPVKQRKNVDQIYDGGIPYTLGLLFNIKNHFFLSAEINPGLFFSYRTVDYGQNPQWNHKTMSANIRFDNKVGLLSIMYRI